MDIKQAVRLLTTEQHRLAWRTEMAMIALSDWRSRMISTGEFHSRIDDLLELDHSELYSDELADLDLYVKTLRTIRAQERL